MKKSNIIGLITALALLVPLTQCFDVEQMAKEMEPVMQGVECLKKFYNQNQRLPNNDQELLTFVREQNLTLDLAKFKTFHYQQSSDTTITLDYELASKSEIKGSFSIDLK